MNYRQCMDSIKIKMNKGMAEAELKSGILTMDGVKSVKREGQEI